MQKIIEFEDKVAVNENSSIPEINKITDDNINEIKSIVNGSLQGTNAMGSIVVDDVKCKNLFSLNNYTYNTSISSEGKIISNSLTSMYYIPVQYGKTYVMSFTDNSSSDNVLYGFSDSIPTIGTNCTYNVTICPQLNNMVFTPVSSSNKYLCIRLRYDENQITNMSNIQVEEGTTPTLYTPQMYFGFNYIGTTYSLAGKTVSTNGSLLLGTVPTNNKSFIGAIIKNGVGIQGMVNLIVDVGTNNLYLLCSNAQTFGSSSQVTISYLYI